MTDLDKIVEIKFPEGRTLGMFIVNRDNKHAVSAACKLCEQAQPGALVMLTADEFDAVTDPAEFRPFPTTPKP